MNIEDICQEQKEKLKKSNGIKRASVNPKSADGLKSIQQFKNKYAVSLPSEIEDFLTSEQVPDYRWIFQNSDDSGCVLCGRSYYSWSTLGERLDLYEVNLENTGRKNLLDLANNKSIIIEDLWASFYAILKPNHNGFFDLNWVIPNGAQYKINLDLESYLSYHTQAKGLFPWQLMFIDEPVEGLELGYEFYEILAIVAEGEPILQLPQFKRLSPDGSLAQMAKTLGYYDNVQKYLVEMGDEDFDYQDTKVNHSLGINYTARVEYDLGFRLPDELRVWFYLYGEIKVQWSNDDHTAALKILPIDEVFGGHPDKYDIIPQIPYNKNAFDYYGDPSAKELLEGCYPFMIDEIGDVVFKIEEGKIVLYMLDSDITEKVRLQVTLPEFITYLCKTRGISSWHSFLRNPNESELSELKEMVAEVFPDTVW